MDMLLDYFLKVCKKHQIIRDDEIPLYKYGLHQLIMYFMFIAFQVVIYCLFGYTFNGIMFMIFFLMLRRYAGGYHTNSELKCLLVSNLIPLFLLLLYYLEIKINNIFLIVITIVSAVVIFGLSPVDNPNKLLNDNEKKRYKLYTRIILTLELIVLFIGIFKLDYKFNLLTVYSIFINALLVFIGFYKK